MIRDYGIALIVVRTRGLYSTVQYAVYVPYACPQYGNTGTSRRMHIFTKTSRCGCLSMIAFRVTDTSEAEQTVRLLLCSNSKPPLLVPSRLIWLTITSPQDSKNNIKQTTTERKVSTATRIVDHGCCHCHCH